MIKRAVHLDFHTMPGIEDFGESINANELANQMAYANVSYVNVVARCNIGYSYYPTRVGESYPTMKGNICADIVKALKEKGIGVTLYLNGGLNHMLMVKNPAIMKIDKNGRAYTNPDENMNFFRSVCFNSEYREHLLEEIKELLEMEPDGIFVDCMIPRSCYCPRCIEKMRSEGIDISDENEVYTYSVKLIKEVMMQIREIVLKEKRLFLNSFPFDDIHEMVSHSELECLPTDSGEWGYDFISAMAPYQRMFTNDRVYMTGCFVGGWGDFGGKKTKAAIENDVYDALLYGYSPSIGDHMHPRDGINKRLYSEIGEIYSYVKKLEKWTENSTPICDTAILRNKCTNGSIQSSVSSSAKGAARMLSELKICFDIINEDMDFDKYKLLVLPDEIEITDKLYKKLSKFKGSILSSGHSYRNGGVWDYFDAFEDENTDGYYEFNGEVFGQYSLAVKMKSDYFFAEYIEPYFRKEFDGIHAYFYNPPYKCHGYSAVVFNNTKAHIGFNVFEAYLDFGAIYLKNLVKSVIERLLPDPLIKSDSLPAFARTTLMRGKEGDILHIKTTAPEHRGEKGVIEEHLSLPSGRKIEIKGGYKKAYLLPDMKEFNVETFDGYTSLILPEVTGYSPFLFIK